MSYNTISVDGPGLPKGAALWHALRRGKLGPLVHASRLQVGPEPPPSSWKTTFRSDYFQSLVSHHLYRQATEQLLRAAEQEGVQGLVLRGTAVAERFYPDPALRPYTDIDFLVRRNDLDRTRELARRLGYRPTANALPDRFYERHHLHLRYVAPVTGIALEIHWALDHPFSLDRIDYEALFEDALPADIGGARCLRPSDVDQLLILALHLSKHGSALKGTAAGEHTARAVTRGLLLWMVDLRLLIEQIPHLDWDRLVRRAIAWEVAAPVAGTLAAARSIVGAAVPDVTVEALYRADGGPTRLERWMADLSGGDGTVGRAFRALSGRLSSSPALFGLERASGLAPFLFPGRDWLERHGPAPGRALPLRRLLHTVGAGSRLMHLAWDLTRLSARRTLLGGARRLPMDGRSRSPARG